MKRTYIKESALNSGKRIKICGWVETRRNLGKLIFTDIVDATGTIQTVFSQKDKELLKTADTLRPSYVVGVEGIRIAHAEQELVDHDDHDSEARRSHHREEVFVKCTPRLVIAESPERALPIHDVRAMHEDWLIGAVREMPALHGLPSVVEDDIVIGSEEAPTQCEKPVCRDFQGRTIAKHVIPRLVDVDAEVWHPLS